MKEPTTRHMYDYHYCRQLGGNCVQPARDSTTLALAANGTDRMDNKTLAVGGITPSLNARCIEDLGSGQRDYPNRTAEFCQGSLATDYAVRPGAMDDERKN